MNVDRQVARIDLQSLYHPGALPEFFYLGVRRGGGKVGGGGACHLWASPLVPLSRLEHFHQFITEHQARRHQHPVVHVSATCYLQPAASQKKYRWVSGGTRIRTE